ncbi:hypothetical protein [Vulcaniibacterium gelatinicum]|uniref:hypothetical protein n=1 Tax=Vulcaniibacterium gelatinicum TaxID=2598725 RepID=UPI003CCC5939
MSSLLIACALPCAAVSSPPAVAPAPEIRRPPAAPQTIGQVHTLRRIPEACVRLEGVFTGDPAQPYRFAVARSSPACQPRARFLEVGGETGQGRLATEEGWRLNDVIRVPSAACPGLQAVVRVWRKPGTAAPPGLDAQGRARIYLQEALVRAQREGAVGVTLYAAEQGWEGKPCG